MSTILPPLEKLGIISGCIISSSLTLDIGGSPTVFIYDSVFPLNLLNLNPASVYLSTIYHYHEGMELSWIYIYSIKYKSVLNHIPSNLSSLLICVKCFQFSYSSLSRCHLMYAINRLSLICQADQPAAGDLP